MKVENEFAVKPTRGRPKGSRNATSAAANTTSTTNDTTLNTSVPEALGKLA